MRKPPAIAAARIPAGVGVLGFVSMLMDISSKMIHSLLPLFLVSTLGVSVLAVGVIKGIAESLVAMNLAYAGSAYPFGKLSDAMSHRTLLALGLVVLIASDLVLALASGWVLLGLGVALWGVHMGMTQGLLAAMVADTAAEDLRGTAYGFFNLLSGIAMLASSAIAGLLWDTFGSAFTFYVGAGFAALTVLGLALLSRPEPQRVLPGH